MAAAVDSCGRLLLHQDAVIATFHICFRDAVVVAQPQSLPCTVDQGEFPELYMLLQENVVNLLIIKQ